MAAQWEIKGKTCLITGGASGIGALYVESYLREGAKVKKMSMKHLTCPYGK